VIGGCIQTVPPSRNVKPAQQLVKFEITPAPQCDRQPCSASAK
jgi:hypothetical protein